MHHRLIQETEQPKRNPATGADLGIVNCKVAVRDIRNLFEGLSLAAHLKEVLVVDEEVSLLGVTDVVQDAQLADEECLPLVSLVHFRTQDVHQVGIAEEYLVRLGKGLVILGLGCEQSEDLGFVESVEHLEPGFVVRGELPPEFRHVGLEGDVLADDHQEFLHLLQRLIGYILHGGKVGINDDSDGLTQPGRKILQGFTVEGVVAVGKVRFEERSHFDASDDFHRFFTWCVKTSSSGIASVLKMPSKSRYSRNERPYKVYGV